MIPFVSGMQCVFAAVSFSSSARCSSFMHRRFNSSVQWMCVINFGQATEGCMLPEENVCSESGMWGVAHCFPVLLSLLWCWQGLWPRTTSCNWLENGYLPSKFWKKKRTRYLDGNCTPGGAASSDCLCTLPDTVGVVGCCQPFSRDQITLSFDSWTSPMILCLLPSSGHTSW